MNKKFYYHKVFKDIITSLIITIILVLLTTLLINNYLIESNQYFYSINITATIIIIQSLILFFMSIGLLLYNDTYYKYEYERKLNLIPYKDNEIVVFPKKVKNKKIEWREPKEWLDKIVFENIDHKNGITIARSEKSGKEYYIDNNDSIEIMPFIKKGRVIGYFIPKHNKGYIALKLVRPYERKRSKY
jgi:hypothetical protein